PIGEAFVLAQVQIDPADELPAQDRIGSDERVIVGRTSGDRHMTDSQFRLRCTRSGNHIQSGRPVTDPLFCRREVPTLKRSEGLHEGGPSPLTESVGRRAFDLLVTAISDCYKRRRRWMQRLRVKYPYVVYGQRRNGVLAANGCVAVRVLSVEKPNERPI